LDEAESKCSFILTLVALILLSLRRTMLLRMLLQKMGSAALRRNDSELACMLFAVFFEQMAYLTSVSEGMWWMHLTTSQEADQKTVFSEDRKFNKKYSRLINPRSLGVRVKLNCFAVGLPLLG
jgi:hypothetical protein